MYLGNGAADPRALRARTAPRKFDFHPRGSSRIPRGTDPRPRLPLCFILLFFWFIIVRLRGFIDDRGLKKVTDQYNFFKTEIKHLKLIIAEIEREEKKKLKEVLKDFRLNELEVGFFFYKDFL